METILLALSLFVCISCADSSSEQNKNDVDTTMSKHDTMLSLNEPIPDTVKTSTCSFNNPDTSLAGVKVNDDESSLKVICETDTFSFGETYSFVSRNGKEIGLFTMHPGNTRYAINEFEVKYADSVTPKSRHLPLNQFQTESQVHLGISKDDVIARFGKCESKMISGDSELLNYRIEQPADTKTKLLERHNMPVYYAEYEFKNDRLIRFKFGLEYP